MTMTLDKVCYASRPCTPSNFSASNKCAAFFSLSRLTTATNDQQQFSLPHAKLRTRCVPLERRRTPLTHVFDVRCWNVPNKLDTHKKPRGRAPYVLKSGGSSRVFDPLALKSVHPCQ